jgi:hypothetical protein
MDITLYGFKGENRQLDEKSRLIKNAARKLKIIIRLLKDVVNSAQHSPTDIDLDSLGSPHP